MNTPSHLSSSVSSFQTQPWNELRRLQAGNYEVERVEFESGDSKVIGNLFLPSGGVPRPGLVLMGPVCFVKEQSPIQYASRLAREGFVCLIFDPRHHGESGGEPRRLESRHAKVADLRAALSFLQRRPEVSPGSLHLVGICQGVNWCVEAAALDTRVRSVSLVAGHYLTEQTAILYLGGAANVRARLDRALKAKERFNQTGEVEYIPIVSLTDPDALLTARPIYDFYYRWADRGAFAAHTGLWENRVARMSELDIWGHDVRPHLASLKCPTLMVHSQRAASGPQIPRDLFSQIAASTKSQVWLAERNQIQFYQDVTTIDPVVQHLAEFHRGEVA